MQQKWSYSCQLGILKSACGKCLWNWLDYGRCSPEKALDIVSKKCNFKKQCNLTASLLKMSLCHRYFLAYFARKTNYLVSSSVEYWNITWKSVQSDFNYIMHLLVIAQWFLCMSYLERITLRQYYSHLSMFYHMHLARFKYINAPQDHFLSQKKNCW